MVDAKVLIDAFPHSVVPHYAWINPEDTVVATTASNDVTHSNISSVLSGRVPDYTLTKLINLDEPLMFTSSVLPKETQLLQYTVLINGAIPSLPSKITHRKTTKKVHGITISNRSLISIYSVLARHTNKDFARPRVDLIDTMDNGVYTFDFNLPIERTDSLYFHALNYLNQHSGYIGQWVKRSRKCFVLIQQNQKDSFISKSKAKYRNCDSQTYQISNYPIHQLVQRLNKSDVSGKMTVLDETGYKGQVDIVIHAPFDDIGNIRRQLNEQGLDLIATERDMEIFEIRQSSVLQHTLNSH